MSEVQTVESFAEVEENEELGSTLIEWYSSIFADYTYKMTSASVLFFISFPWVALFWPPYYFMRRRKE